MIRRRDFLAGAIGMAGAPGLKLASAFNTERTPGPYFGLNAQIEANPKAVFIRRTHVKDKMDEAAKLQEGLQLAREIFVPMDQPGIPITHRIVLKPNVTSVRSKQRPDVDNWGAGTDPQFYEGLVTGLKEIGLKKFHFVEANLFPMWNYRGFMDINERLGIVMNEPERRPRHFANGDGMTWTKVPDAVVYTSVPHYAPVNEPDTWLLNIAKWKAHTMCLTQSVKNEQGMAVSPFQRFCMGMRGVIDVEPVMKPHIHPQAKERLQAYFESHQKMGYSRYGAVAFRNRGIGALEQEIWAHKTLDNQTAVRTGFAMIEGIYGRDGDGFGVGNDYLTNIVLFGKDKFRLDLIGLYLGGHEPGNVNLYRIAKERGLSDTFNPWEVPIFEWENGKAIPRKLSELQRFPLKTLYLQQPGEERYHLVNEPFDYEKHKL